MNKEKIEEFLNFVSALKGDEKGEAQLFCDRLFRAFGHGGIIEANGTLEARIKFNVTNRTKFADCLWCPKGRSGVLIEMKKRNIKNLEVHFSQARDYWLEMDPNKVIGEGHEKPKYIILCNFDEFIIYKDCQKVDDFKIEELPERYTALNFLLPIEKEPLFQNNIEQISKKTADRIGELYKYLTLEKLEPQEIVQHFILQCVLAFFSEDFGLLPQGFFTQIIKECKEGKADAYDLIGGLFKQMASPQEARGGRFKGIEYFNGGLFENVEPIELDRYCLDILYEVALKDWKQVHPAIFGALFEGTMDSNERHKFGAHFTNETDMLRVITPTIIKPWKAKIEKANTIDALKTLLGEIGEYKVLDPACGCGNFLFVAYRELKELECQIFDKMAELSKATGKQRDKLHLGVSHIQTSQFYGLDIQPMAVEVAKMTMMIAKELVGETYKKRTAEYSQAIDFDETLPLDNMDENILVRDALFDEWPMFDVVIGNPPYQSKNKMSREMDLVYVDKVRKAFPDVPGRADFCVYWFYKAHTLMKDGQYAGLVGTNTIRQNYSRMGGLDYIVNNGGTILDSVSTEVWSGDAAVYVSIATWKKGEDKGLKQLAFQCGDSLDSPFEYYQLDYINSSLSLGNVTDAKTLNANKKSGCCAQGQTHGHKGFLLERTKANMILAMDRSYKEVIHPFLNGDELLGNKYSQPERYVIDFRGKNVFEAQIYKELYNHIYQFVYPDKKKKSDEQIKKNAAALALNPLVKLNHHHENFFKKWWKLSYDRTDLMNIIHEKNRYIACSRVTKRPIFEFVSSCISPSDALTVFPMEDDYSFGILQSEIHWEWFTARCSTLKGDWRYTSESVFNSFPWPQCPTKVQVKKIADLAKQLRMKRREIMVKNDCTLRDLYRTIETTRYNPISEIQDKLDMAVREAYGMKKKDEILPFLLKLNHALAEKEKNDEEIQGPGLPSFIKDVSEFISDDCVKMEE